VIELTPSADYSLIASVATHPRLYKWLVDDGSPSAEAFVPDPRMLYLLVREDGDLLGLFMFEARNAVTWEVHTALLPHAWGERARTIAAAVVDWLKLNTSIRRLITTVPAYNRAALRFAEDAGLVRFGVDEKSFLRKGKLWNQILLGLSLER